MFSNATKRIGIAGVVGGIAVLGMLFARTDFVLAHCQIPCGIYDDDVRFVLLEEDIATIEKSISQILELSADPGKNANQLIRWTLNKDEHADHFGEIVSEYFLRQRIAPVASQSDAQWESYVNKVVLCHRMLVASMKAKQTTDMQYVEQLRQLVADFHKAYFTKEQASHLHEHHSRDASHG